MRTSAARWSRPAARPSTRSAVRSNARWRRSSPISCRSASNAATAMRDPSFWWRKAGPAASLLAPLAAVYGAVAGARLRRPGQRVGRPVICIGNFTVGGAGKTPAALAVAQMLVAQGERPFFLSRGYGGQLAGPLRVDPALHRAADVGYEPLLLVR